MRVAAFRKPLTGYSDFSAVEQTLECDISFAAYNYINVSSFSGNFHIQTTEMLSLDHGHFANTWSGSTSSVDTVDSVVFNTSGLPTFALVLPDIAALLDFFPSDSFSGVIIDGEDTPIYADGIAAAIRHPQTNISDLFTSTATSMTDQLRSSYDDIASGKMAKSVVLVRVQWAWLTPAALRRAGLAGPRARSDDAQPAGARRQPLEILVHGAALPLGVS